MAHRIIGYSWQPGLVPVSKTENAQCMQTLQLAVPVFSLPLPPSHLRNTRITVLRPIGCSPGCQDAFAALFEANGEARRSVFLKVLQPSHSAFISRKWCDTSRPWQFSFCEIYRYSPCRSHDVDASRHTETDIKRLYLLPLLNAPIFITRVCWYIKKVTYLRNKNANKMYL